VNLFAVNRENGHLFLQTKNAKKNFKITNHNVFRTIPYPINLECLRKWFLGIPRKPEFYAEMTFIFPPFIPRNYAELSRSSPWFSSASSSVLSPGHLGLL
jgi:hypothetical protein